jgi:5-methylcytosine-specific restriction endonuclease McrA
MTTPTTLVLNRDMMPISVVPLSVISWQRAVRAIYLGVVSVIHSYEDRPLHSPSMTMDMPSIVMVNRYMRPRNQIAWCDTNLFLRDRYTCQYCAKRFPRSALTFDHVLPQKFGGKTNWTNIVAACSPCNGKRGHNTRIRPMREPYEPTYHELVACSKELPLVIPHVAWADYLMWPEENLIIRGQEQNNKLPITMAA